MNTTISYSEDSIHSLVNDNDQAHSRLTSLALDKERYRQFFKEEKTMNEKEIDNRLEAIWEIMICVADIGWGKDSTQTACGEFIQSVFEGIPANDNMVKSDDKMLTDNFDVAAKK